MPTFSFDDFALTTLNPATNAGDGSLLSDQQKAVVLDYLKSPGSGPDTLTSYEDFLKQKIASHPPKLPPSIDYVAFSGKDRAGASNFLSAVAYVEDADYKAGIIGNTPWGK